MDIRCATCLEPWDHHHLRHDMIWEIWDGEDDSQSQETCKAFLADPRRTLTKDVREALADDGWSFGATIFSILRCSCCDANARENGEPKVPAANARANARREAYLMLEECLGDDHDGLISTLHDFDTTGLFDGSNE